MTATASDTRELLVPTRLFGPLKVPADRVITFAAGLPGFEGERRFALLQTASPAVHWMQAVDDSALCFLLIDPFATFAGYELELPDDPALTAPLVFLVVTLPAGQGLPATANLQAPIIIDAASGQGRQVVLEAPHDTRRPFDLAALLPEG